MVANEENGPSNFDRQDKMHHRINHWLTWWAIGSSKTSEILSKQHPLNGAASIGITSYSHTIFPILIFVPMQ